VYRRLSATTAEQHDLVLDALSYMIGGSPDQLRGIASDLNADDLFVWRTVRLLSALGHLDVELDSNSLRLRTWHIAPPCLVQVAVSAWVLTGARSDKLVEQLEATVRVRGGQLSRTIQDDGPSIIRVSIEPGAISSEDLRQLSTPLGHGVMLSPYFAQRAAPRLPSLSQLLPSLPEFRVGSEALERFDLGSGRWAACEHDRPGAYRVSYFGRTYGYTNEGDLPFHRMHVADAATVKHLAAAAAGASLIGYDPESRTLSTSIGAELPALLERVAVMCSGTSPRLRSDTGFLEYANLPPEVAGLIYQRLRA
jgi:hypothetical protein